MAETTRAGLDRMISQDGSPGLREQVLKQKRTAVVTGGAAAAQLTCADGDGTNIKTTATIISAIRFAAGVPSNLLGTDTVSIPVAGAVAFDTTDTTGSLILVEYFNHD